MIEVTLLGPGSPLPDVERAGVGTLILTHHVPALVPGTEDEWRALAAPHFSARVELGSDLHRVEIG